MCSPSVTEFGDTVENDFDACAYVKVCSPTATEAGHCSQCICEICLQPAVSVVRVLVDVSV